MTPCQSGWVFRSKGSASRTGRSPSKFDDGTAGRYDLVLGADGVHSHIRRLLFDANSVRRVGQVAWRFVTECPPDIKTWTVMLGRGVAFLAVPIGQGRVYCYCDAPSDSDRQLDGDDVIGRLTKLLSGFSNPVPTILDTLGPDSAVHVAQIEEVTPQAVVIRIGVAGRGCGARDVAKHGRGSRNGP